MNRNPMTRLETKIRSGYPVAGVVLAGTLCLLGTAWGQESPGSPQPPLGDVVRHQREDHQHAKAKRVMSDDDLPSAHSRQITGMVATTKIIPYITVTGTVPEGAATRPVPGTQKMYAWFGPTTLDSCSDLDCAEATYLKSFPMTFGGTVRVLFESDDTVQDYPARIAHIEIIHDVRGKMLGTVAFIETPEAATAASCLYRAADAAEVEPDCDAFMASLKVHVPEKYIYVQSNR